MKKNISVTIDTKILEKVNELKIENKSKFINYLIIQHLEKNGKLNEEEKINLL